MGKDAVNLQSQSAKGTRSSRRRGGITTQGFTNYFSLPSKADSDNDDDKSSEDDAAAAQNPNRPRSDDLLTRLRSMDGNTYLFLCIEFNAESLMYPRG